MKANRKNGFALAMRVDPSIESQGSFSPPSSIITSSFEGQSHEMVGRKLKKAMCEAKSQLVTSTRRSHDWASSRASKLVQSKSKVNLHHVSKTDGSVARRDSNHPF